MKCCFTDLFLIIINKVNSLKFLISNKFKIKESFQNVNNDCANTKLVLINIIFHNKIKFKKHAIKELLTYFLLISNDFHLF